MANLPGWVPAWLGVAFVVYLASFFLCGSGVLDTSGTAFEALARLVFFQFGGTACSAIPGWVGLALFSILTLPFLLLLAAFVFSNTTTTIVGLVTAAVAAVGAWISGLF